MKGFLQCLGDIGSGLAIVFGLFASTVACAVQHTESISLKQGWNAVYLTVTPSASHPDDVFKDLPVDIVAVHLNTGTPVEFIVNPDDQPWKRPEWRVWYASDRSDSVLSNLYAINGHASYLIKAREAFVWQATGAVKVRHHRWATDGFTLSGFQVSDSPPTFQEYFSGSAAHSELKIYKLDAGIWKKIVNPNTARPSASTAYWVYTKGASTYPGPLKVGVGVGDGIEFEAPASLSAVTFSNTGTTPQSITIERLGGALDLSIGYRAGNAGYVYEALPATVDLPPVPVGHSTLVQLLPSSKIVQSQDRLLQVTTDSGVRVMVPVSSNKPQNSIEEGE